MRGEWSGKIRSTPTDVAAGGDVELLNTRRVERADTPDPDPAGDLADREGRPSAAAGLADHNAFEDLDTLLLALPNTEVDVDRVAHAEGGTVTQLRLLNRIDFRNGSTHH